jgi:hypothetical protein
VPDRISNTTFRAASLWVRIAKFDLELGNSTKQSGDVLMQLERHRARRYPFHASIELTNLESETQSKAQTSDLSLFGCHVDTSKPLPAGTKVRIKISHRSENFEAQGRVAYSRRNEGMGIHFANIEPNDQLVLDKWIAERRDPREQR